MGRSLRAPRSALRIRSGFSLVEIMITVALLAFIVIGLMAMFGQVQKAFRISVAQTDVLESGRATMDLITRELEQTSAAYLRPDTTAENFYVIRRTSSPGFLEQALPGPDPSNPGKAQTRTNVLQEFFFLSRVNTSWIETGYLVTTPMNGVGTLYRFQTNSSGEDIIARTREFKDAAKLAFDQNIIATNYLRRIADGIVHLRVRAYDHTNGLLVFRLPSWPTNVTVFGDSAVAGDYLYSFQSNALPAYLELELGVLEARALERFKSIPNAAAKRQFLERQAGHVHVFRQRIAVRNVDPSVYQ